MRGGQPDCKRLEHCRRATNPKRQRQLPLKGGRNLRVFVKNMRGDSLMPTTNQKARKLLKLGEAKIYQYNPFTIQLLYATGEAAQPCNIGIDTGAKMIGVAITSEDKVLVKGEIELRQDVSEKVQTRAILRRGRRNRKTRYRKARFLNRKRKPRWLPPSVQSKLNATTFWIDKFISLVPNPRISIEVGKFDVAKMINPEICGTDYQNGQVQGYYDVRYFVFARDKYTCQVCKKKNKILNTHHILYREKGGTNRATNLITVCTDCHTSENHRQGGILHQWMLKQKRVPQYKEPMFMNIVRKRTFSLYPKARITYGSETCPKRKELGLEKTHYNDAIAISGVGIIFENPSVHFYYKQFRKKKRSLHESTPRKGRSAKNIASVRNNKNVKHRNGYYLNDEVVYKGRHGWVYGYSGGEKSREFLVREIDGVLLKMDNRKNSLTLNGGCISLVRHNNGWQYQIFNQRTICC